MKTNVFLALLVALAICLFVAVGGDGESQQEHADWMASTKDAGSAVMW